MSFLGLGLSLYKTIKSAGAVALTYVTDSLKLYFNFAKETSEDPVYTGHKEVQFASAGSTSFDGTSSDGISFDYEFPLGTNPKSITMWFKCNDVSSDGYLFSGGNASTNQWFTAKVASAGVTFEGHSNDHLASQTILNNKWYHLAITYDGTDLLTYIDGILKDTAASIGLNTAAGDFYLGRRNSDTSYVLDGAICNTGVWERKLEIEEIQSVMHKQYADLNATEKQSLQAWYNLDAKSNVLEFPGDTADTDYIDHNYTLAKTTDSTWSMWLKATDSGNATGLFEYGDYFGQIAWHSANKFYVGVEDTGPSAYGCFTTSATAIDDGEWHHIAGSWDQTTYKFYIDGVLEESSTTSMSSFHWGDGLVGSSTDYGTSPEGQIASFAVWESALSASNITSLYNLGINGTVNVGTPTLYYVMNNATTVEDLAGSNDGTIVGDVVLADGYALDSHTSNNLGVISGATTTVSVYGGNAPKLPRSIDIATETFGDAIGLGSYQFNGSSDYVSCGNDTSITSAVSNLSVCCWFKTSKG